MPSKERASTWYFETKTTDQPSLHQDFECIITYPFGDKWAGIIHFKGIRNRNRLDRRKTIRSVRKYFEALWVPISNPSKAYLWIISNHPEAQAEGVTELWLGGNARFEVLRNQQAAREREAKFFDDVDNLIIDHS